MMDGETGIVPPEVVGYSLGPELLVQTQDMAARIAQGLIAMHCNMSKDDVSLERAASLAVEMAMHIANEVRLYRLVDNRAVKING